ncbi:MAG: hypothetical protein V5A68_02475 [Candidatus Thermoplasmatota archaeon]
MPWIENVNKFRVSKEFDHCWEDIENKKDIGLSKNALFLLSAAVGIINDRNEEIEKKGESINFYTLKKIDSFDLKGDTGRVIDVLMAEKYPEEDVNKRKEALEEFANWGVKKVHEQINEIGSIDEDVLMSSL